MPKPKKYGVIYNWDGAPHGSNEYPQSMQQFLDKMYDPLADTQVGAHFWCTGEDTSRWKSKVLELTGDAENRKYENTHSYISAENVRAMIERGEDPQAEAIKRGRELGMDVYASIRMNDNHFNGLQIDEIPNSKNISLTKMRRDHPEWMLGEKTHDWFAVSWNMEVPEIREYRFNHVKEVCTLWDWDGVELDWQRHNFHLPNDDAYRLRYVLTDLQRAIRQMTNEIAKKRGRPFYLAARVSGTLEMSRHIGYDIPTWVNEGLVDILIPSGGSGTDPLMDIEEYVELCNGTDIDVYGAIYGSTPGHCPGPEDEDTKNRMLTRGIANNIFEKGAVGTYCFNWHSDKEYRRELLNQIGSTETLKSTDKIYAATHRTIRNTGPWRKAEVNDRIYGPVPVALKKTLTGDGPTISLDIPDDLLSAKPKNIELRIRFDQWVKEDRINIYLDQKIIEPDQIEYTDHDSKRGASVSPNVWMRFDLTNTGFVKGTHEVKIVLVERTEMVTSDIIVTDVELVVRY